MSQWHQRETKVSVPVCSIGVNGIQREIKVTVQVCSIGVNGIHREIKVTVRVCSIGANDIQREIKVLCEYAPEEPMASDENQGFCASMLQRSR